MDKSVDKWQLIILTASRYNILPLTSTCNLRCVFCSHRQNPPGVEAVAFAPLALDQVDVLLDYLDGRRKIVIGESATRLLEGEPLTHPYFLQVMARLRRRYPQTLVEITTNGLLLDQKKIEALEGLKPLEMNISVNSLTPAGRQKLLGNREAAPLLRALEGLTQRGILWHGSLVAYPSLVGWEDIGTTIGGMAKAGASTIRVFLPGFTRLAPSSLQFDAVALRQEMEKFLEELRQEIKVPLLLEPPLVRDLTPRVAGVIPGSPAEAAGLQRGDIILYVDGKAPRSRVEAFGLVSRPGRRKLRIRRGEGGQGIPGAEEVTLDLSSGTKSGIVLEWDADPAIIDLVEDACRRYGARRALIFTSELAGEVVRALLQPVHGVAAVRPVRNYFFGGSIACAGLLTVADFVRAWKEELQSPFYVQPDLVLLPGLAFDFWGRDLTGRSYGELAEISGLPVEVLRN
ncbi:radical SAM protein [Moorellaceae bacterium AZ2]